MCGLARAKQGRRHERRQTGGFGSPAVLLGRAVVQSVVGVGQRCPACLASVQRADGLIPQPHRTGRGTERSSHKGRRGASGTSHLSHAGHATTKRTPPQPTPNHKHTGKNKKYDYEKRESKYKKERSSKKENQGIKQRTSAI